MEFVDRVSAYPNRYILTTPDGKATYVILERADEPTVVGTPLNAETFNALAEELSVTAHEHNASDISSGTLPVARGGTGATTAAGALSKLGLTATATELNYTDGVTSNIQTQLNEKAASSHNHSASNITSGTLPIARGGTGATTGTAAIKALFAAGSTVLSSYQYGTSLPAAGTKGRIFFKKVSG